MAKQWSKMADISSPTSPRSPRGIQFRTDLDNVGKVGSKMPVGSAGASIVAEERQLIDKVFSIVDRDNSGSVDMKELEDMFNIFGVNASALLKGAITRVMANVDKDFDGQISPEEFYKLLSQKFEEGDTDAQIESCFNRMDKNKNGELGVDELHDVAVILGENIDKSEIKNLIKAFNTPYQEKLRKWRDSKKKNPSNPLEEPKDSNLTISLDDFKKVMREKL